MTLALENLERADFIKKAKPISNPSLMDSKTIRYYLWDDWLKFHCTYIEPYRKIIALNSRAGLFEKITAKSLATYYGLAFERLCLKNLGTILQALEIPLETLIDFGPYFKQGSRKKGSEPGIQIDLLLLRQGQVVTLIECKFTEHPIDSSIIPSIERKLKFLPFSKTHSIEKVLISAAGVTPELRSSNYFHQILGLEAILGAEPGGR